MPNIKAALVAVGLVLALAEPANASVDAPPVYTNPVADEASENFADPTIIRGRDGYWYAYATGDPRFPGDFARKMKIIRSSNMDDWEYVGDVFTPETEPRYDGHGDAGTRLYWAPAIKYFNGQYYLYYSFVVNVGTNRDWRAIGVATAPHPGGPWTDSGSYVTGPDTWEPRPGVTAFRNIIDPEVTATSDGKKYLYYGSVNGGVRVVELTPDGLHAVGGHTQITPENRYEAASVVYRDGYYYLFLSVIGGCCNGPASAYPVHVGRSTNPRGPFLGRDGSSVLDQDGGGTPVQVPNGNRWLSVGHTSITTDLSGQEWLVSHGIDRFAPYLQGTANNRHLVISRLDWIDGWPTANAGQGLLDGPLPAPASARDAWVADSFEAGSVPREQWVGGGGWQILREPAGGYLYTPADAQTLMAVRDADGDARIRGAVRLANSGAGGSAGFVLDRPGHRTRVAIDRATASLIAEVHRGNRVIDRRRAALPPDFDYADWHELDIQLRGRQLTATLSDAGLGDLLAWVNLTMPASADKTRVGVTAVAGASFDDVTVAPLFQPITRKVPDPQVGRVASSLSEEFDGELGDRWSWLRTPAATVENGQLRFPVQRTDLIDGRPNLDDSASLLLTDAPTGAWTAEVKVTVPFGDGFPLGWPQAGLVMYVDDDHFVEMMYTARNRTRLVSLGKEMPWLSRVVSGDAWIGPTADTMWLRLQHTIDPQTGEHHYRGATSTDGRSWIWHGTRVLPADTTPRLGLAAYGIESDDTLVASFDHVRIFQP